jgi:phosphate transport system permease protein
MMQQAKPKWHERVFEGLLAASATLSIFTTLGILYILLSEAFKFFSEVSFWAFITGTEWTPLFAEKKFGILPLLAGTFLTTAVAIGVALPLGLIIAIFLNEYASDKLRATVKPLLEILASIPSVVYGFFALTVVTPFLQRFIPGMAGFNALSPGIVMGIMIIPLISSLCEDALATIPRSLKEASYALGATRFQTAFRVLVPAAYGGIAVAVILGVSRAIGETMIVAVAAGQEPRLTANPLVPIETITTYIVQVSLGDVPHNSLEFRTIYAAGITLFVFTFVLNNIGSWLIRRYQHKYD